MSIEFVLDRKDRVTLKRESVIYHMMTDVVMRHSSSNQHLVPK